MEIFEEGCRNFDLKPLTEEEVAYGLLQGIFSKVGRVSRYERGVTAQYIE